MSAESLLNTPPQPFAVRLWSPDEEGHDERESIGRLTIRGAFDLHILPQLQQEKAAKSTIELYFNAIRHWERLMPGSPTLSQLDDRLMDRFRSKADKEATTCNKWFRHLRAILNKMGPRNPRDKRSRRNLRYFDEVPYLEDLPEKPPTPMQMRDNQVNQLYEACKVATWPFQERTGVTPPHWWRTSLVYLVNYAARRDDWLFISRSNFDFETGEFSYVARKTGKLHELVLNDCMRAHLASFPSDREFVFSPTNAHRQLYVTWHAIQGAAGVSKPNGGAIEFQDLRRLASQRYHKFAPGTASLLLGHSLPDARTRVTKEFYIGRAWLEPLFEAIRTIPQPTAFRQLTDVWIEAEKAKAKTLKQEDPGQKRLF